MCDILEVEQKRRKVKDDPVDWDFKPMKGWRGHSLRWGREQWNMFERKDGCRLGGLLVPESFPSPSLSLQIAFSLQQRTIHMRNNSQWETASCSIREGASLLFITYAEL